MCGRYTLRTNPQQLALAFGFEELPAELVPRYNVAPTQDVLVVRQHDRDRAASMLRWGLIPSWSKDAAIGGRLINARAETVAEKPAFRAAFKSRRCLIAADGFYEWQKLDAKRKQPWYFRLRSDEPFAFAGLWETWRSPEGHAVETCTLITGAPNELVAPVHDRMPVILPPERYDLWLDLKANPAQLTSLLLPYPPEEMSANAVSPLVNSPRHEGPELLEPMPM